MTESLVVPLSIEDCNIQSSHFVSPTKWHLAHTSWFFENFVLRPFLKSYRVFHPKFEYLFNSYYETVGNFSPKSERGILSRPPLAEVGEYRKHVTESVEKLLSESGSKMSEVLDIMALGIHHEQQHQELILMDIKHVFASNPLRPAYLKPSFPRKSAQAAAALTWTSFPSGRYEVGHRGNAFAFDNETPRHSVYVGAFALASRLVTNGEYLRFIEDGGYEKSELWLSDGWNELKGQPGKAPLYWETLEKKRMVMTLRGLEPLDENEPVCHVSYYEADAYARWTGTRLPTEMEWEVAAQSLTHCQGNFLESGNFHPAASRSEPGTNLAIEQLWGDVWEWTRSAYAAYPGFRPSPGSLGEYNGKFMCNQMVLRGGAAITPISHMRTTYRNFYPPGARWQFSGIRLAEDR